VLYPEQSVRANPRRCWNWFLPKNQTLTKGEPAAILALVERTCQQHPIDRSRIFVAGLSAGGAMAAILAEQAPGVFAAAGIAAGVPLHAAHDLRSAPTAMSAGGVPAPWPTPVRLAVMAGRYGRLRVSLWAGADDRVVDPSNTETLGAQFRWLMQIDETRSQKEEREDAEIARWHDRSGQVRVEIWRIEGMAHAWSGGSFRGSHTHPSGPRATDEMLRFFLEDAGQPQPSGGAPLGVRRS
jgi:poly(hydroxyalkanoate) depolymerase family esterase